MRPILLATVASGVTVLIISSAMRDVIRDAADDMATGQSLYETKCSGCHSVDTDRIGPRHRNVVGRAVASIAEYDYSPALQQLGGTWTAVRLDQFLGPEHSKRRRAARCISRSTMRYSGVSSFHICNRCLALSGKQ